MTVVLYNPCHAGDIVLSRTIIADILRANPGRNFELQCRAPYTYLWHDLGAPVTPLAEGQERVLRDEPVVCLWFALFSDLMSLGLTYANQVATYNRQAPAADLNSIQYDGKQRFVALPPYHEPDHGLSVLVENGPVLSGQMVLDVNPFLDRLATDFPQVTFFCSAPIGGRGRPHPRGNLRDVSSWNLCRLSSLSNQCRTMISRLSAVTVCSFTEQNHGRKRIVFGHPLGCPIWDEKGIVYARSYEQLKQELQSVL